MNRLFCVTRPVQLLTRHYIRNRATSPCTTTVLCLHGDLDAVPRRTLMLGQNTNICAIETQTLKRFILPPRLPNWSINQVRNYAKGKDKGGKSKGKGKKGKDSGKPKVSLSDEEINNVINFDKMKEQMTLVLTHLQQDFAEQLTLRTNSGVLDSLMVETPDGKFPLIQLGSIIQKNPQLIIINLSSVPQYIGNVKSAITDSGMNLNPQQDGTSLFVPVPKVTREHREGLAQNAKLLSTKAKDKLRDLQNRYLKDLKKVKGAHSEDLIFATQETIMASSHEFSGEIDIILDLKQKELSGK